MCGRGKKERQAAGLTMKSYGKKNSPIVFEEVTR